MALSHDVERTRQSCLVWPLERVKVGRYISYFFVNISRTV